MKGTAGTPEKPLDPEKVRNPKLKALLAYIFGMTSEGKIKAPQDSRGSIDMKEYSDYSDYYDSTGCYTDGGF